MRVCVHVLVGVGGWVAAGGTAGRGRGSAAAHDSWWPRARAVCTRRVNGGGAGGGNSPPAAAQGGGDEVPPEKRTARTALDRLAMLHQGHMGLSEKRRLGARTYVSVSQAALWMCGAWYACLLRLD